MQAKFNLNSSSFQGITNNWRLSETLATQLIDSIEPPWFEFPGHFFHPWIQLENINPAVEIAFCALYLAVRGTLLHMAGLGPVGLGISYNFYSMPY